MPAEAGRRFVDVGPLQWELEGSAFLGGADVDDAMLTSGAVIVLQTAESRITALDISSGRLLWKAGRKGAGPGEYAAPATLFPNRAEGVGVVDPRQGRITFLDHAGEHTGVVTGELFRREPHNVCAAHRSYAAIRLPALDIAVWDSLGSIIAMDSLMWPEPRMNEVLPLQQGLFARSRDGRCIIFSVRGDYFFEFDPSSRGRSFHRYQVPFEYPDIIVLSSGVRSVSHGRLSAAYAALDGDRLYVLADRGAVVDTYNVDTGEYAFSFRLSRPAYEIDVYQGRLMVLERSDEEVALRVYGLGAAAR